MQDLLASYLAGQRDRFASDWGSECELVGGSQRKQEPGKTITWAARSGFATASKSFIRGIICQVD